MSPCRRSASWANRPRDGPPSPAVVTRRRPPSSASCRSSTPRTSLPSASPSDCGSRRGARSTWMTPGSRCRCGRPAGRSGRRNLDREAAQIVRLPRVELCPGLRSAVWFVGGQPPKSNRLPRVGGHASRVRPIRSCGNTLTLRHRRRKRGQTLLQKRADCVKRSSRVGVQTGSLDSEPEAHTFSLRRCVS